MSVSQRVPKGRTAGRVLIAGMQYFAIVFSTGFVLGTIRTLWLEPRFGTRWAELMEMPLMLVAIALAARWVVHRSTLSRAAELIGTGAVALGLLLTAEFSLVLWLRGLTFTQYVQTRDPVAGAGYILMVAVFALMPLHCGRAKYGNSPAS